MAVCKNCFIFDEFKLQSKIGFFETRQSMVVFILNAILNIEKYFWIFVNVMGRTFVLSVIVQKCLKELNLLFTKTV